MLSRPQLEALVDSSATALDLPLAAEHRPGVIEHFTRLSVVAQTVIEFPLPEETEPAPVFAHAAL